MQLGDLMITSQEDKQCLVDTKPKIYFYGSSKISKEGKHRTVILANTPPPIKQRPINTALYLIAENLLESFCFASTRVTDDC